MSQFFAPPDWPNLLAPPAAQMGYAYKLEGRLGMAGPPIGPLGIDEQAMTADFVISTEERDRSGDIMVASGCDLTEYRLNPIVLLGHRQVMPGQPDRPFAIGTAESPDGILRVWQDGQRILARCHFHADTDEAREAWLGVKNGWLRGASIGYNPISQPVPLPPAEGQLRTGYRFDRWKLLEFSVVVCPMNASCVSIRKFLESGKIEGRAITPMFRKALEFAAELPAEWSNGWTKEEAIPSSEPLRWNRQLSKSFDVASEPLPPSTLRYDWVSRYVERPVKHVFKVEDLVPSVRMGGFLLGLAEATAGMKVEDVRNISGDSESPPVHESIKLNSTRSDSFLVDGMTFLRADWGRVAVDVSPEWNGLSITVYSARENATEARKVIDDSWEYATKNNPLRGEAFALSGEFLERTVESWDDVFLEAKNRQSLQRTVELFNARGASFANRGVILTGPPGTGKTLSGRILRNLAKGTFIWLSSRDFHYSGSFGGVSLGFRMAKELAPAILFIEDVDNWLSETTIDLIKTEMDGIARSSGVWTILTTNFPERLPSALIDRPGRFHDVLKFGLPDSAARQGMLGRWLPSLDTNRLTQMVTRSEGFSGAHVYELAHFAKTLNEQDGMPLGEAVEKALAKVEEQRQLIDEIQMHGSRYDFRRLGLPAHRKADFREEDHPRAEDGKFGSGGGGQQSEEKPAGERLPKDEKLVAEIKKDRAAFAERSRVLEARRETHAQKQESLDRLHNLSDVIPGWSPTVEDKLDSAEQAILETGRLEFGKDNDARQAFVQSARDLSSLRRATFEKLASSAIDDCASLGASEKTLNRLKNDLALTVKWLDRAGEKVARAAEKVASTDAAVFAARDELEELEVNEPEEPAEPAELAEGFGDVFERMFPEVNTDDISDFDSLASDDPRREQVKKVEAHLEKVQAGHDRAIESHQKEMGRWEAKRDRAYDKISAAEDKASSAFESFESSIVALGEEYAARASSFQDAFGAATDELDSLQAAEADAIDEEEGDIQSEMEDHEEWISGLLAEEDESDEEADEQSDEQTQKQLAHILAPLPAILRQLKTGLQKGTLTMKTKAFPAKPEEDNEEPGAEKGKENKPPFAKPGPDSESGERPAGAPGLAELMANLTAAIVAIQEAVQPKEVPAAAPEPAPAQTPEEEPPVQTDPREMPDRPPSTRDDPRRDSEEREEARETLERYRQSIATYIRSLGATPAITGMLLKSFSTDHMDVITKAGDHLDELANMDVGSKWSGSHQTACRAHCLAMRAMCKALSEAGAAEGGATVEPSMEEKQQIIAAMKSQLEPVSRLIYQLTGRRIA